MPSAQGMIKPLLDAASVEDISYFRELPELSAVQPPRAHLRRGDRNVTKKKKPPIYRVMLHNDTFNRREYVVSVLLKVVDGLAMDEAVNVMQASIICNHPGRCRHR